MKIDNYTKNLLEDISVQGMRKAADSAQKLSAAIDKVAKTPEARKRLLKSEMVRIRATAMKQSGMPDMQDMNNAIADILQHAHDAI